MYKRSLKATGLTEFEFNSWLIQQILKKHDRIKEYLLKGKLAGQIVQAVEANIMHHLAAYFQEAYGFACLTVYDEFIVPSERIEMVREQMFDTVSCGICEQHYNVYAHMWWNIAASKGNENAAKNRDMVAEKMTPSQLEKAQDLARECVKKNYKDC